MKINRILFVIMAIMCMTACDESEQFEKELYKKVIYVISDEKEVFSLYHDLNQEETMGFISIGCGGTKHIDKDAIVVLEPDEEGIPKYNKLEYDIEESKFAHALDPARYRIPEFSTVLKADSEDNYSTLPIYVRPEGLSPDSIYFIPLRIKSVSMYEVNPDKSSVLYQVLLKNDYAVQSPTTRYSTSGIDIEFDINGVDTFKIKPYTLNRPIVPLTKNTIRCFVGLNTYVLSELTTEDIQKYGMRITINEDNTLSLEGTGSAQIEMLGDEDEDSNYCLHYESDLYLYHYFTMHYRYRLLKEGADGSNEDEDYEEWHEITETMSGGISK